MFEVQQENYEKYNEINDERLHNYSKKVMDKYNSTQAKAKDLVLRQNHSVEQHLSKNVDRF